MKRILIILFSIVAVTACNETDGPSDPLAENPLSECILPSSVQAGSDALVQWNGFPEDPVIKLVAEDGTEYDVEVSAVTASGVVFRVPAYLTPGNYKVMLGDQELGVMEVTPPDMPVSGIKIPRGANQGEEVAIDGIGFEEGCVAVLVDSEGNEYELDTQFTNSGISIMLPDDLAAGDYTVYLIQNGMRWLLTSSFSVYVDNAVKTLTRIDYYSPYVGTSMLRLSWEIYREEPVTLTVSQYVIEGTEESLMAYDRYICDGSGNFILAEDGFEESNDLEVSYVRDADGTVTRADVLVYGDKETTPFSYTYNPEGFLVDISTPKRSFRSFSYADGNLTVFRNTEFEYTDKALANHPSAADVVWGYMSLMEKNDPFVYFPYLLGWYDKTSVLLPTAMLAPSPENGGKVRYSFAYEFDSDGYVVRMAWDSDRVEFIYDLH